MIDENTAALMGQLREIQKTLNACAALLLFSSMALIGILVTLVK